MIDRKNVRNLLPLTALQEGMLYHALRAPESRAYFERLEYGLDGPLDAEAWLAAWQDLCDRHDMLRSVFAVRNTPRPLQVVLRAWPLAAHREDLSALSPEAARARIEAWKADDLARGFVLTAEVPMRLALFRLAPGRHRVVWSFHHILLDGWSLAVLQRELDACYLARLDGRAPDLPPAPAWADTVRWLEAHPRAASAAFWRETLAGFARPTPVPARLAARFADPAPASPARTEHRHALGESGTAALAESARRLGVTPATVAQALWGLLLGAAHGSRDAVFAATVAGRPAELPGADATVGLFINAIPVRVRAGAGATLADTVRAVHAQAIAARVHHAMPLPDVQAAHPLRDRLLDHILVFENYPAADPATDPRLPRAEVADADLHEYTHYAFEFQFLPGPPATLRFRFDPARHDGATVAGLGERFAALLDRLAADPEQPVDAALAATCPNWRGPRHVGLAASFTVEPAATALEAWLRAFGQPAALRLAPYAQCARALLDPAGALAGADLALLLYRPEDALRDLAELAASDPEAARARLHARHDAVAGALADWLGRDDRPPLVVARLPGAPEGPLADAVAALDARWRAELAAAPEGRLQVLDLTDPLPHTGLPAAAWLDAASQRLGHLPYGEAGCAALGAALARPVLARARAPFKVIAVDCDNTLWLGVCGEAGPLGVRIGPAQRALQRYLIERQAEGFLIVLASKNQAEDVWAVLDRHPDMLLRREHLAGAAIDWQPKPDNLRRLAGTLRLGLDSFLFLDDNPAEIARMQHDCPEVLSLPLPADPGRLADWLPLLWAGDVPAVTAEDRERTRMLRTEASREAARADAASLDDFLAGIGLSLTIGPVAAHQRARVAQLTQRTNQFNLSGRRRDEGEIAALAADPDWLVWAVEVEDRFGAYGLTGVVIAHAAATPDGGALRLDTLLLSCRVLGRRVEDGILHALADAARARGLSRIEAPLVATARNQPLRDFLAASPWQPAGGDVFTCAVEAVGAVPGLRIVTGHVFAPPAAAAPAAAPPPRAAGPADPAAAVPVAPAPPLPFPLELVDEGRLRHGALYLPWFATAAGWPWRPPAALRDPLAPAVAPGGRAPAAGSEAKLAALWEEVLGGGPVPAETPFADLGGHSLHAVRVVARIERAFGVDLGLARFYALGTVAALAAWLDSQSAPAVPAGRVDALDIPRAAPAGDYPLSPSQYRVWLLSRLGNAPAAYNQCAAFRLRGPLDVTALTRALNLTVARHESLRTVFPAGAEGPRQRILDTLSLALPLQPAPDAPLAALRARIAAEARQPFDLEHGPLLRATLHRRASDDHVLALTLHHIVGDGWSFGRLLDDLAAAYAEGGLPPPPALRYRDYAVWTRSPGFAAALAPHAAYWRRRLGGDGARPELPAIAAIPCDHPRPPAASGRGGSLRRRLPLSADERARLDGLLAQHGASLFQLLASLVMALIARHGEALADGGADGGEGIAVRVGTPVAGREPAELESVLGICVNTLVLDARVRLDQPFTALLADVRATALAALDHQRLPFDRLVEDLAPERDAARNPLFDVLVALQNAPRGTRVLPGITVEDLPVPIGVSAFDLVFEFAPAPGDGGLDLELTWASDLYDAPTGERLASRLDTLLRGALATPHDALGALPLCAPEEVARLAAFARGPRRPLPADSLAERFHARAAALPAAPALLTDGETLDFATLAGRAARLAGALRAAGVTPGTRVAVLLPRDPTWPVALLATLYAGAVYLPLEARHPPQRLGEILADAAPGLLLTVPELAAPLPLPDGLAVLDARDAGDSAPALPGPVPRAPGDEAYLLYTSGSTGRPKGVRVTHGAFLNMIAAQIEGFAVGAGDVALQLASCAFDASLSECFLGWLAGAPVALADAATVADSARLGAFLARHRVTLATFTPSYLQQLEDADLAGLRRVILAGEAVQGRDVGRLLGRGIGVYNAYGPTETAVCATLGAVTTVPPADAPVPIGRPLANLELRVHDARGAEVPIGVPGELTIHGAGVALGYWQRPELDRARFLADPRRGRGYRSGDLVRWRDDGQLEFLGRRDDQVKLRGQRIEPGEIAARLRALPGVRQAAVLVEEGAAGPELVAWIAADPAQATPDALRAALAPTLPAYMLPVRWHVLPVLPLTASGKLDRRRLSEARAAAGADPAAPAAAPAAGAEPPPGPLEAALLGLWQELLGPGPDRDSDLFLAGGNSLTAMKAARRAAALAGRPCPPILVFRFPTPRALAAALAGRASEAGDGLWTTHGPATAPRLVALPPAPGLGAVYAPLVAQLQGWRVDTVDFTDTPLAAQLDAWCDHVLREGMAPAALLGHSGGGRLALALARRLAARGQPPRAVLLGDCWRWREEDPAVAPALAELHRRAGAADRALAAATGLADAPALVALGQAYRRELAALARAEADATPLAVPVHHLLAEVPAAEVPAGFDRDWSACTRAGYHPHPLSGGHDALLAGPTLAANAARLRRILDGIADPVPIPQHCHP